MVLQQAAPKCFSPQGPSSSMPIEFQVLLLPLQCWSLLCGPYAFYLSHLSSPMQLLLPIPPHACADVVPLQRL